MRSRRTLLAVLGGIVAFALVVGAAASLGGLTSTNLGADTSIVAACDTRGITSAYTTVYVAPGRPGSRSRTSRSAALRPPGTARRCP